LEDYIKKLSNIEKAENDLMQQIEASAIAVKKEFTQLD